MSHGLKIISLNPDGTTSPYLAAPDHFSQSLYSFHGLVLQSHGEENRFVPSFLRHERHQVFGTNMNERLKRKGIQMYTPTDGRALPQELGEEESRNDVENLLILDSD